VSKRTEMLILPVWFCPIPWSYVKVKLTLSSINLDYAPGLSVLRELLKGRGVLGNLAISEER
jgi:hypothetical protein